VGKTLVQNSQPKASHARWEQLEAFAAVAEQGGFAAAARVLGRDASVISRRVEALEARLGVRLLARTTRQVALTEAGRGYLRRVQGVLAELASADAEVAEGAGAPRGVLRLSFPAKFARLWVAPWLPSFLAAHPLLRLETTHTDRFVDLVAERFDAAIRISNLADSGLVVRHLAPSPTLLCAAPSYLAVKGTPKAPTDLKRHACLSFPIPSVWPHWRLRRGDEKVTVRVAGPLLSDDGETLVTACTQAIGIMLAPNWLVGRELSDGRLVRVLPDWELDVDGAVQLVLPPGRLVPAKTRAFVERVVAEFTPSPPWLARFTRRPRAVLS
jgi:DNA-binding transcriptional LysR family regulator